MDSPGTISGIVFIVVLIFPGVIFKRFYYKGSFKKQFGAGPFADRILTSIFWGFVVQLLSFVGFSIAFNFHYNDINVKIRGLYKQIVDNQIPLLTFHDLAYILTYIFVCLTVAAFFGFIAHEFIRLFKLDVKSGIFKFSNEWHYYFTGEILLTKEFRHLKKGKVFATAVDVLIDNGSDRNKMMSGILSQYTLSSHTGELESIYLTASRKYSDIDKGFKSVPGSLIIIPYNKVVDMNLTYLFEEKPLVNKITVYRNSVMLISLFVTLAIIILPWFSTVSFGNKTLSVLFFSLGWLFAYVSLLQPYQDEKQKLSWRAILLLIALSLLFFFLAFYKLRLIFK